MQAIILAAGIGIRLRPITEKIPKALLEIKGSSLIFNALDCLSGRDISEVLLVVGYKKNMIIEKIGYLYKGMKITYIENPIYYETNNVYSFWLTRDYIHEDIIMLECDLFYERSLIDIVLQGAAECNVLVSPYNPITMDGTVVHVVNDMRVDSLVIKRDQKEDMNFSEMYKTVNIYTFKQDFICNKYMPAIDTYVRTQSVNSYYELVLGALIYFGNDTIKAIIVDETQWSEVDDKYDLKRIEEK